MLELKVIEQREGSLVINYEEFRNNLQKSLEKYRDYDFDEKHMDDAKKDRAMLNAASKAINDRKVQLKKQFLKPYEEFEKQAKELIGMIDECSSEIDGKIKKIENEQQEQKAIKIAQKYKELGEKVPLDKIWNPKWLNKGYSMEKVFSEIKDTLDKIDADLDIIFKMAIEKTEALKLQAKYLNNLDLQKTINDYENEKYFEQQLQSTPIYSVEECLDDDAPVYSITIEVTGTKEKLRKLSCFLKENNYNYKKL